MEKKKRVINHNIKIQLEDLMWQNRIKSINQLSEITKISRETLSRLKKNEAMGINLDTLETLCFHLNCEITDLLVRKQKQEA